MKTKVNRSGRRARSAAAVISLFSVTGARAVSNFVWTGGVGDGNWNTNANWFNMTTGKTAGTYPGNSSNLSANAVIDDATFDNTNGYYSGAANLGSGSISIPAAGIELGTISFGDAETNGIYTLSSNVSIGSAGTQIILNGTAGGLVRLGSGNDGVVGGGKSGLSYNGTSGVQTILSNLVANNNQSWSINGTSGEILAEGTIANSAGQNIIKSGAGELEIAADNSATLLGGYTAQGGTTLIDKASSLGISSSVIQIASTTSSNPVSLLTGSGVTFARNIVVVTNNKNETETLGGNSNTSTWTGSIAVNAPVSLTAGSSGTTTFTGIISDGTGGVDDAAKPFNFSNSLITKVGTGTVVLSGSNTYSGGTNISAGVLTGTGPGAFGTGNLTVNPTGGTNTPADAAIVNTTNSIAPGAVVTINTNSNTATGKVNFWGSSETIGGLAGNGTAVLANSSGTSLTIGSAGSSTFSGTISDANGLGSLIKIGAGQLTLNGSNTYGGGTNISAGTLLVGNQTGSATGSGAVTVGPAGSLGGTGLIAGPVTVNGTLFTGLSSNTSGKTASVLTLGSGSVLNGTFLEDITSSSTADQLVFNGSTGVTIGGSIDITNPNNVTFAAGQSWQLINFGSNAVTGNFSNVILPALPSGLAWNQSLGTAGTLSIFSNGPTGPGNLTWSNASGNGTWDTTSANWNSSTGTTAYSDNSNTSTGDNVTFTGSGNYTVSLSGALHPTSVAFTGTGTVRLTGVNSSSGIAGPASLTVNGTGKLTLSGSNTYTGGTNVAAGTLVLASSAALPVNSNLNISSGAVVQLANHGTGPVLVAQVGSLSNGGQIDITNNALVISGGETYQTVWNQIANQSSQAPTGINSASGTIISSTAQNDPSNLTTIGISTGLTSFEGLNISSSAVVVKYTYFGDATLDGQVDGSDYSRIDNGVLLHLTGWQNGDFNYDGVIDGSDYTLIDNAFNTQGASLASEVADPSATATSQIAGSGPISAVPEPAALGLIGMMSAGLLGRRRRR